MKLSFSAWKKWKSSKLKKHFSWSRAGKEYTRFIWPRHLALGSRVLSEIWLCGKLRDSDNIHLSFIFAMLRDVCFLRNSIWVAVSFMCCTTVVVGVVRNIVSTVCQWPCTCVNVCRHKQKIQDFPDSYYSDFDIIIAGLDNIEARRWLNSTVASLVSSVPVPAFVGANDSGGRQYTTYDTHNLLLWRYLEFWFVCCSANFVWWQCSMSAVSNILVVGIPRAFSTLKFQSLRPVIVPSLLCFCLATRDRNLKAP